MVEIIFGLLIVIGLSIIIFNQFKIRRVNNALSNILLSFVKGNNSQRAERVDRNIYAILASLRGQRQYSFFKPDGDEWKDVLHDEDY